MLVPKMASTVFLTHSVLLISISSAGGSTSGTLLAHVTTRLYLTQSPCSTPTDISEGTAEANDTNCALGIADNMDSQMNVIKTNLLFNVINNKSQDIINDIVLLHCSKLE